MHLTGLVYRAVQAAVELAIRQVAQVHLGKVQMVVVEAQMVQLMALAVVAVALVR